MEIPEIKQHLTFAQVLQHYHLKPDKSMRLHCPFHEDKTQSLQVYYKTHTAFCFSANCKTQGKSMDVIDFVMHQENTDKHGALLKCAEIIQYYEGKLQLHITVKVYHHFTTKFTTHFSAKFTTHSYLL